MAALERAGLLNEELLILGALFMGLAFTFALPVQTAMVPRLVSEADTEAAMAMNSVSYNAGGHWRLPYRFCSSSLSASAGPSC